MAFLISASPRAARQIFSEMTSAQLASGCVAIPVAGLVEPGAVGSWLWLVGSVCPGVLNGGFLADFGGAKTNRHLSRAGAPPRLAGRSAERSEVRVQSSGSSHVLRTADKARPGLLFSAHPRAAFGDAVR